MRALYRREASAFSWRPMSSRHTGKTTMAKSPRSKRGSQPQKTRVVFELSWSPYRHRAPPAHAAMPPGSTARPTPVAPKRPPGPERNRPRTRARRAKGRVWCWPSAATRGSLLAGPLPARGYKSPRPKTMHFSVASSPRRDGGFDEQNAGGRCAWAQAPTVAARERRVQCLSPEA